MECKIAIWIYNVYSYSYVRLFPCLSLGVKYLFTEIVTEFPLLHPHPPVCFLYSSLSDNRLYLVYQRMNTYFCVVRIGMELLSFCRYHSFMLFQSLLRYKPRYNAMNPIKLAEQLCNMKRKLNIYRHYFLQSMTNREIVEWEREFNATHMSKLLPEINEHVMSHT